MFGKKLIYVIKAAVTWEDVGNYIENYEIELYESWFGRSVRVVSSGFVKVFKSHKGNKWWPLVERWRRGYITTEQFKKEISRT